MCVCERERERWGIGMRVNIYLCVCLFTGKVNVLMCQHDYPYMYIQCIVYVFVFCKTNPLHTQHYLSITLTHTLSPHTYFVYNVYYPPTPPPPHTQQSDDIERLQREVEALKSRLRGEQEDLQRDHSASHAAKDAIIDQLRRELHDTQAKLNDAENKLIELTTSTAAEIVSQVVCCKH